MLRHSQSIWIVLSCLLAIIIGSHSVELERRTCFKDNFPLIASDNSETCMNYVHKALYSNRNNSFVMQMSAMNFGPVVGSMQPNFKFNIGDLVQCEVIDNALSSVGGAGESSKITKTVVSSSSSVPSAKFESTGNMKIYTTNAAIPNYVYIPASPSGCFSFKVRAKNMVHISLNSVPYIQSPMYEIVLAQKGTFGYAAGTSVIRKNNNVGTNVAQVRTNPNILNESEFMGFWVKWCTTGLIEVGYEGEEMPFLYYKDTSMFAVNYIGIMTHSCAGAWHIQEPKCPGISKSASQTATNEINGNLNVYQPGVLDNLKSKFGFASTTASSQQVGPTPLAPIAHAPVPSVLLTTTSTTTSSSGPVISSIGNLKVKCWRIPSIYSQKNFTVTSGDVHMEKEFDKLMKLQNKVFQRIEMKYKKYENLPVPLQKNKRYLKDLMLDLNDDYQKAKELNDKLFFSTIEFEKEPEVVQKYFKDDRFNTINTMYFDLNNKVQSKIKQVITEPDAEWHVQPSVIIPDKSGRLVLNVNGSMPQQPQQLMAPGQNMSFYSTRTVIHFTPSTVVNLQNHLLEDLQSEYDKFKKSDQHSKAYLKLMQQKLDEFLIKAKDRDREIKIMHADYEGDKNFNNYYKNDVYKKITTTYNQFNIQLKKEFEKNSNSNIQNLIDAEANYTRQIEGLYGDFKMEGKDWTKEELESTMKKCENLFAEMTKVHSKLLRTEVTDDKEELIMKAYLERNQFFNAKVMFFAFYGGLQGAIEEKSGPIRIFKTIITPDNFEYKYFNAPESKNLTFKILAQNDAHILLTKGLGKSDAMFEIFLGEEYNTASSIRKNALKYVTQLKTPNLLSAVEPKEFWITWSDGHINVGRADESKPFMTYTEKKMFPINFIGIRTIDGSSGTWYFEDALVTITEYEINVKKTTIFQGKTTVVRG